MRFNNLTSYTISYHSRERPWHYPVFPFHSRLPDNKPYSNLKVSRWHIPAVHPDPDIATQYLQCGITLVQDCCYQWRVRINEKKSIHISFTLKRSKYPPDKLNNEDFSQAGEVKYLGFIWTDDWLGDLKSGIILLTWDHEGIINI